MKEAKTTNGDSSLKTTPMMRQFMEAKKAYPDALLLFRMGDFYEMFNEDARTAARVLSLALTSREKGENAMPMAGFPHLQLESYVAKLIASGCRVAVCDQVEDPKLTKGLVKREVTRVVTPGTLTEDVLLDPRESNYLAAVVCEETLAGVSWVDLSTGKYVAASFPRVRLLDQLARIAPSECLLLEGEKLPSWLSDKTMLTKRPVWAAAFPNAFKGLTQHFRMRNLEGFGFDENSPPDRIAIRAAGLVLDYLQETQKVSLQHIDSLMAYRTGETLEIDEASRRSLEISRTLRDGRREGSLLAALDIATTSMGSRMLADWIANPLTNLQAIQVRQDTVEEFLSHQVEASELRRILRGIYDIERLLSRVSTGRATPRDIFSIGQTLKVLPSIKSIVEKFDTPYLQRIHSEIDTCPELERVIESALAPDPPLNISEGGIFREGYNAELDELRDIAHGGREWISKYQAQEQERTGIQNLKVGFNKVFGYYIEVNHSQKEKVPDYFIRRQTVKNAERFITPALKEYEEVVLSADEKQKDLERCLFLDLRDLALSHRKRMRATAAVLAELDVLLAFAELAQTRNYCKPTLSEGTELEIIEGRHPVLDVLTPDGAFVPNDVISSTESGRILLITGPNMAGKSTYIRQVALLTLMAQIGCYIPAKEARIGLVDQIFTRVGASDELARGQSTFMVEMTEAARILNMASYKSLVILDEIGRGTSTYDGISLARAIIEYIYKKINCRTLFATHYHELTDMVETFPLIRNLNVSVREWNDEVVFLHKIVEGAADKSYGIHVARLAGVPGEVLARARDLLEQLEAGRQNAPNTKSSDSKSSPSNELSSESSAPPSSDSPAYARAGNLQFLLFDPKEHPAVEEIRALNINKMTPLDALQTLERLQKMCQKK
ncbi:MAG: DNA mismatch repair protein MutS [Planctomycetia bacterium]|nr:DNA mismatch repair protein MutS [Planctomycetia bacterium]